MNDSFIRGGSVKIGEESQISDHRLDDSPRLRGGGTVPAYRGVGLHDLRISEAAHTLTTDHQPPHPALIHAPQGEHVAAILGRDRRGDPVEPLLEIRAVYRVWSERVRMQHLLLPHQSAGDLHGLLQVSRVAQILEMFVIFLWRPEYQTEIVPELADHIQALRGRGRRAAEVPSLPVDRDPLEIRRSSRRRPIFPYLDIIGNPRRDGCDRAERDAAGHHSAPPGWIWINP
jgi:hypothetical protein